MGPRLLVSAVTVLAVSAMAGCSSVRVEATHDSSVDFTQLHTYAWLRPQEVEGDGGSKSYGWRVREAVDKDLNAKGFTPAQGNAPDFLMNYSVQTRRTYEARGVPSTYGEPTGWGPTGSGDAYSVEHQQSTLVLSALDPITKKQIWRGEVETRLTPDLSAEELTARVNAIVARMLQGFPP